ncbi:MAG: threonine--tRNA ligase [Elusimicrobia bacterium]|nr:threonine--tRNA ligase [Elusimicrobiota bacterium]MDE2510883.1 threonine--tRNA ligase [Elusimicrobiota bacterium]
MADIVHSADPNSPEALDALRHSCAHVMAQAVQELFPGTKITIGPAIENGFYYDFDSPHRFSEEDFLPIQKRMLQIAEGNVPFVGKEVTYEESKAYWTAKGETYKVELLEGFKDQKLTHYSHGTFTDLCRGGHTPSTKAIRHFKILSVAGAYWRGDEKRPMLQRLYATAWPTKEQLNEHLKQLEEAKKRDHRKLGPALDLFSIQDLAGPGLIFWHPKGGRMRMIMEDWLKQEALKRGYQMVYSPHIANKDLWNVSGHTGFYRQNMFGEIEVEKADYMLKPMNCPCHILIYKSGLRSYKQLPMRLAELGTVYRYERSGVLHGLMRVRGFTQDDAHIFCTPDQIESEIEGCLDFALKVFEVFGFTKYQMEVSTWDPEKSGDYVGEAADWERSTNALISVLDRRGTPYKLCRGEAAFYGPKIDVKLIDAIGRPWQLSTVQFDFNLPKRFEMEYVGADGARHRPLMVHRALYGSIERFFGILVEHYAGHFPLWLAPVQVKILTLTDEQAAPAEELRKKLEAAGLRVEADLRPERIQHKIREASLEKIPYMIVMGPKDVEAGTLAVRLRDGRQFNGLAPADFIAKATEEAASKKTAPSWE